MKRNKRNADQAFADAHTDELWTTPNQAPRATRSGATVFSACIFLVAFALVLALFWQIQGAVGLFALITALVVALLAIGTVHMTMDWERACVMRLGVFNHVAGPGVFFTIPVIDQIALRVDQRINATPFYAEKTLTSDLVPVDVDAVLFWMVWDAKKACLEVNDYAAQVSFVAQTAMREAIGRASIARVALQRDQIDQELEEMISNMVEPWGVTIISVKVRDIVIPQSLQDAMSQEAQAERQKEARIVLADVEREISEMLSEAAKIYDESDTALRLRTLHLLNETVTHSGGSVVTVPSSFSDGFTDNTAEKLAEKLGRA